MASLQDKKLNVPEFKLTQVDNIKYETLPKVTDSSTAVDILMKYIIEKNLSNQISVNEFVFVLYLNKRNIVLAITTHSIGSIDASMVDSRLIFAQGLLLGATNIIIAHNHPTGNLRPSDADKQLAKQIGYSSNLMLMKMIDFLILTSSSGYYSFADERESMTV